MNLIQAEAEELASLISTPRLLEDNYERFYDMEDAMGILPRVKELISKTGVSDSALHDWLLKTVSRLVAIKDEVAPRLPYPYTGGPQDHGQGHVRPRALDLP